MGNLAFLIRAYDRDTGEVAWECSGPDERGACTRIAVGEVVPCVEHLLARPGATGTPYTVPPAMTLCPITLALAVSASCDALVAADG